MSHQPLEKKVYEKEAEEARTKDIKSGKKYLIEKKFQFISAFDKKVARNFLNAKHKALEKITFEDEDIIETENKNINVKRRKSPEKKYSKHRRVVTSDAINVSINSPSLKKRVHQSGFGSKINNNKTHHHNKDVLNSQKHKFYSSHELKMFGDKEIKKIKSIKKKAQKKKSTKKNEKEEDISMNQNDSSIFDILSQLK